MKLIYVTLLFLGFAGTAGAQPVKDAKCAHNIQIRAPKDGAGVFFDRDCKVAYVLPPVNGQIALEAIAKTSSLTMCPQIANIMIGMGSVARDLQDLASQMERSRKPSPPNQGGGGGSPLFPNPTPPATPVTSGGFDFDAWQKQLDTLLGQYAKWINSIMLIGNTAAATAQFSYFVGHQQLVDAYQKLNPQITFRPITLVESRIVLARPVGTVEQRTLYPAVIFSSLPGFNGAAKDGDIGQGVDSGEMQSGQIGFSLVGICPYYRATTDSFPAKLTGSDLAANMVANVRYVYELQAERRYRLTYNMGAMLRRLQTSESHNGFFTTSAVNRLIIERSNSEEFDIQVESEDGRWQYDETMAQTLKAQLLDRAFKDLGLVAENTPGTGPVAGAPKANGADAAATEIGKCPYVYCQIASGVLRVASAVFGGSNEMNEYINSVNVKKTETSEDRRMLSYHGVVNFTPARK